MNKISLFFSVLMKSFSSPSYYTEIVKQPFGFSLTFFLVFSLIYGLAASLVIAPPPLKQISQIMNGLPDKLNSIFPSELEITITHGEVSTNVSEPYSISMQAVGAAFPTIPAPDPVPVSGNLLVIDTKASANDFSSYKTFILLTKNSLVVQDNNAFKVYPLTGIEDMVINKSVFQELIATASPFFKWVVPAVAAIIVVSLLVFLPSNSMTYLLFFSLVGLLVAKIMSLNLSYKKTYQIGMHLIVIPTTILGLLNLLGLTISFPFFRTLAMTVLAVIVFAKLKQQLLTTPNPNNP